MPEKPDEKPEEMPDSTLRPFAYHVVRYTPNLLRDEWVNIGILLADPASGRLVRRFMEEPGEFARVRRLHPAADEDLLRRLPEIFETPLAAEANGGLKYLERLEQTLSNGVQLASRKGLLGVDLEA